MSRVADTSFLYAAFDNADERHEQALDEIAKPHALNIPLCVMAEFLDLVTFRHGHNTALQVHADLTRLATVTILPLHDEENVLTIWANTPRLSMADAAGIQASIEGRCTLLSYDENQLKALTALRKDSAK